MRLFPKYLFSNHAFHNVLILRIFWRMLQLWLFESDLKVVQGDCVGSHIEGKIFFFWFLSPTSAWQPMSGTQIESNPIGGYFHDKYSTTAPDSYGGGCTAEDHVGGHCIHHQGCGAIHPWGDQTGPRQNHLHLPQGHPHGPGHLLHQRQDWPQFIWDAALQFVLQIWVPGCNAEVEGVRRLLHGLPSQLCMTPYPLCMKGSGFSRHRDPLPGVLPCPGYPLTAVPGGSSF